ncbi:MAG: TIGR04168 family protein [Planctomycetota bacterium]
MTPPPMATLTIVGDVHRSWRASDAEFLCASRPDLAMFVGDLGDEDVEMVREIARIEVPKVVLLGNHDAWQSCSNNAPTNNLLDCIEDLGDDHLAFAVRELPEAGISIVGARPFSWGDPNLRGAGVFRRLYGFHTMKQSAVRIVEAARRAQHRDLVILAHNGPMGLGRDSGDIWGKDFGRPGGDWGDRDLATALERIGDLGLRVRAVVAGHMHDRLLHPKGQRRKRFVRRFGTLFLNTAVVPRIRADGNGGQLSHFARMQVSRGEIRRVEEILVDENGRIRERSVPEFLDVAESIPLEGGDAG